MKGEISVGESYETPEMEVILFNAEDVISTSIDDEDED